MPGKRVWPWAAGVVLLAALLLVGRAAMVARQAGSSQVRYATGVVKRGPIQVTATGTGTVAAVDRQALFAETEGVVAAVPVKVGDRVKAGQTLIQLANDDVTLAVEQARLQLEQARQRLRAAGPAAAAGPLSGAVDVTAPAAGRIVGLRVRAGDTVQQGAALATLADSRSLEFVTQVLEPERARLRPGQAAVIQPDDFDGAVQGRVRSVGDQEIAGQTSVFYEVRVSLDNPGLLREGMTGQVTIQAEGGQVARPGFVAWTASRSVTAPISGRIEQIGVVEGQTVQAGQRIARIANENWPAEVEQLRLAVSQAEINRRSKEEQLNKLTIRSPADGVVVALNVQVGDRVVAGARAAGGNTTGGGAGGELAAVAAGETAVVNVAIDEMDVSKLRMGQKAVVTLPALPGKTFGGEVRQIAQEGKSQNGVTTYDVQISVDRPEGILAGMTATASIEVAGKQDALLVPVEAVADTPRGPVVRVLDGDQPRQVPVRLGLRNDRVAEVLSGLRVGDQVVLAEYNPSAAGAQGFGPPGGRFGPGGFPGGGLMGPGGFRGPGGSGGRGGRGPGGSGGGGGSR